MKLLFDQNISFRIIKKISAVFPHAKQVRELGLENAQDRPIWEFAKENAFAVVTFDADFVDLNILYGHPPKVIWLRIGNTRTDYLAQKLLEKQEEIKAFLQEEKYKDLGCLEIVD